MYRRKQGFVGLDDEYVSPARRAAQPYDLRALVEPPREVIDWDDRSNLGASRPPSELRSLNLTTRQRLAQTLRGDQKATSPWGQFVEDLTGSSGLGESKFGLIDMVPFASQGLAAEEALDDVIHGDYLGAIEGAAGLIPWGKAFKMIRKGRAGGAGKARAPDGFGTSSPARDMKSPKDYPRRMTLREATDDPSVLPPHQQLLSKEDDLKQLYGISRQEYERNNIPGRIDRERLNRPPFYGM
ncbi:hypothetical protein IB267_03895 [Ensifer sp. ENS09]|uniref:hypothetical protein n=1 Tax=Ensifer sp. ENS09 TaxID=2769263 RepID=UPI00178184F1|nr:hypothetical protein [Ensifer sp. ENS09]MBD9647493.1 hypothetical protein [Ensifer sp. ENS09]